MQVCATRSCCCVRARTRIIRRDQYRYGGAGGAASLGAIVHGRRLTKREKKNGTRRFSPVDDAARMHLHGSFLPDCSRALRIALAERPFPYWRDDRQRHRGERKGGGLDSEGPVDRSPRAAPRRRLTIITMAKYASRVIASSYLIWIRITPHATRTSIPHSVYYFPALAIARNCATMTGSVGSLSLVKKNVDSPSRVQISETEIFFRRNLLLERVSELLLRSVSTDENRHIQLAI